MSAIASAIATTTSSATSMVVQERKRRSRVRELDPDLGAMSQERQIRRLATTARESPTRRVPVASFGSGNNGSNGISTQFHPFHLRTQPAPPSPHLLIKLQKVRDAASDQDDLREAFGADTVCLHE